jgi:hypothetical protein
MECVCVCVCVCMHVYTHTHTLNFMHKSSKEEEENNVLCKYIIYYILHPVEDEHSTDIFHGDTRG